MDEAAIRTRVENGDFDGAATEALRLYGAELYGFLVALARDETDAADAFSFFAERFWQSLTRFDWRCSLRTWAYRLARNALVDVRRGRREAVPLSQIGEIAERVRTETATFLRSEARTELARLRSTLPTDDQQLLVLRIDRDLAWDELARVFAGDDALDDVTLKRESARLRKRFELVKRRFVDLVRAHRRGGA
jgi:RNA polymerase sigma-70 factor (ECF subfamily)